ncbi:phage portal protein [Amorphus sp. MBR-141]
MLIDRFFRRPGGTAAPEAKASRTGPLIAVSTLGRPVWTPRDYGALAREGFGRNPVVYRCVRMIAEAAASVPVLLYRGEAEIERHPLTDLLARPNGGQAGTGLLEAVYGHLLVAGNAYLEAVSVEGRVRELFALRPDRMRVLPGASGWPEAFEYTVGGRAVRFSVAGEGLAPILHLTLFHPLNDHYGFAPIEAAQTSLDIHNAAGAWNKALLDNAARPSGALVYSGGDGTLTADQFERLKSELEDGYQGARNAGRPLLLEGGLDWRAMALTPKDMDFIEAKNQAAREIALAFGVPPMLLGIPGDNTFANYQEANRALWRQTVLPLVGRTLEALGGWLGPAFGDGLRLACDADRIEALSAEREALWRRLEAASFLSDDEKRAAVGYSPRGDPPAPEG